MAEKEKPAVQQAPPKQRTANIIRLVETNIDGSKKVRMGVMGIKGVGVMLSNAISSVSGFGDRQIESLSQEELKKLEAIIMNPGEHGIPKWMFNRRFDPKDGTDRHLVASRLEFSKRMDINDMKRLKTYRGVRHSQNLPVRGQRTRSSFRKSGKTIGVSRKKQQPAKKAKK